MIELCYEYLSVQFIWLFVIIMSSTSFRVNLHFIVAWMSRRSLLQTDAVASYILSVSSKEFIYIVCDMIITYTQMRLTDK